VTGNAPDWLIAQPIAHRGLHDAARPENTLFALRAAMAQGFAVEADVRLSRDGAVFVFHDDELDRLTGRTGFFRDLDCAQAEALRLRGGERIPSLAEFLRDGATRPLILELKSDFSGDVSLAGAVLAALSGHRGPVALKSFDPALIAVLRAQNAPWPLGIVAQADYDDDDFKMLSAAEKDGLVRFVHARDTRPDFLSWRSADLPNPVCELARSCARMPVMSWTVRSREQAERVLRGADQIVFEGFAP